MHSRFQPLCIVKTLLVCPTGGIQNGNKVQYQQKELIYKIETI